MEAAGLVVGITAFAGQTIEGILTLKSLFRSYKAAADKVQALNCELDDLSSTLENVQDVLKSQQQHTRSEERRSNTQTSLDSTKLNEATRSHDSPIFPIGQISTLEKRITQCHSDLSSWIEASKHLDIGIWNDFKTFRKKLKVATNKDVFDDITSKISSHRQAIGNCLLNLNLSVSCDNHAITRNIKSQLDDLTSNNLALVDADSWLDPVVSDRLPESRHLSDALRDLNNEADSRHAEQMDCMKSLVGSLSSIQSLLSSRSLARPQTPNRNGSFHSPKRSPARDDLETFHTKRPFAAESIEDSQEGGAKAYSCGAVLGIEELLTESGQCFFCELSNTSPHLGREQMQFLDAFSFGKHLVDEHQFGACSSQCYRDFSHFSQHLFEFHHVRSLTWSAVRRHERLRDMGGQEMFFVGEDILDQTEADLDPARGEIEPRPATASIIEAQLAQILSKAGVLDGEADSETHDPLTRKKRVASEGWRQGSDIALLNLGCQKLLSQGPSWDTALEALYQTTRLREEVMISGLDSELPFHRFNQNQQHMEGTRLHLYRNAYEGTYAENSGKSCVLLKLPKLASWYRELATACWYCTRAYKTGWVFQDSRAVQVHLKAFPHEMDDQAVSAFLTSKVQVLPRVLNVSYGGSSTLERIDRWMLHCFLESANWRVLFRLSNPLGPSVDSNMEDWEVAVLQHWCEDGNRRERHMTPASDSAPSKAGSFATRSKRSWPTHFGDQGTNSEVSQGPRKKARIGDDRSQ